MMAGHGMFDTCQILGLVKKEEPRDTDDDETDAVTVPVDFEEELEEDPDILTFDAYQNQTLDVGNLNDLTPRHASNDNYSCDLCDFFTPDASNLKRHKRRSHAEKRLTCNKCVYVTNRPDHLKRHISSVHERMKNASLEIVVPEKLHNADMNKCDECFYITTE